jgi:DNA-binding MarR family transcriptional regulator
MRRRPPPTDQPSGAAEAALPVFELDQHLFFWITQLLDRRDRHLAAELKAHRLRVPEWRILASLLSRHRLSMSELAELTSIERTTLSRTVDRMVRAGQVVRLTDAGDARVVRLALTAAGERLCTRIWPAIMKLNDVAAGDLPEPALGLMRWALQQMCRNFDAHNTTKRQEVA